MELSIENIIDQILSDRDVKIGTKLYSNGLQAKMHNSVWKAFSSWINETFSKMKGINIPFFGFNLEF